MKVLVFNQQKDLFLSSSSVKNSVEQILAREEFITDEISIHFVTSKEISRLHKKYFNDPSPTDCISFPIDGKNEAPYHILGEIFICPKTAIDFILKSKAKIKKDFFYETTLYLVHGVLHLLGHDDREEIERKRMRAAEKRHMNHLILKGAVLSPEGLGVPSSLVPSQKSLCNLGWREVE